MHPLPPKFPLRFLQWLCREDYIEEFEGDLTEVFRKESQSSPLMAKWRFAWSVMKYVRPEFIKSFKNYQPHFFIMYKNYFKTAWRNIVAKKTYATINVSGLALGIACALLIFLIVQYHLAFDNFHTHPDQIYRFVTEEHRDLVDYEAAVPPAFGRAFRDDYAFGEKVARLCTAEDALITIEEGGEKRKFKETVAFVDPEFFDIFNFPLLAGKRDNLLLDQNVAIVSERVAKKYFGPQSPLGKIMRFVRSDTKIDFTITGVLKNPPVNTDLPTEIYLSYSTMKQYNTWFAADDAWGGITSNIQTFTRLRPGVNPADVEKVLPAYVKKYRAKSKNVHHYKLQPLREMHFDPRYGGSMSMLMIWTLSTVGFLLVFTACLNFINLSTAQAITRAKEVGVRKVLGSVRAQLFWQFTTETGVIVSLATLLAFCAAYLILPYLNELFQIHIALNLLADKHLLLFLFLVTVLVTLLSGAYPGIVLSRFKPVLALKGTLSGGQGNINIRRGLIIAQFTISQVLLIGLIVMFYQMKYIRRLDMGFDSDAIIMVPTGSVDMRLNTLKAQFEAIPHVEKVSACYTAPASDNGWTTSFRYENREENEPWSISFKGGDENYLSTFGIELVAGRNLTPSDSAREFLVNEKTVSKLGLSSPEEVLGRFVSANGGSMKGPIVGVVKDFHDRSFHSDIQPVLISSLKENYNEFAIKMNMTEATRTLVALEKAWSTMYPELIYQYNFLDDQIASFYKMEQTMMTLVQVFSFIALAIGALGLYGLVSFMSMQKTKEIGIRKVLGSSVPQILWIFGREFSRLVVIAFFIAAPLGWALMSRWLSNYAYKMDLGVGVFMLELLIIFGVVLLTAGLQSLKAAVANPVTSLRSE